jgi:hypothetical protein
MSWGRLGPLSESDNRDHCETRLRKGGVGPVMRYPGKAIDPD